MQLHPRWRRGVWCSGTAALLGVNAPRGEFGGAGLQRLRGSSLVVGQASTSPE